ncbi:MAG: tRNA uridine-5-carboxymethylaminomethyl(34) synthesis GTPase MnmE [Desulfurivibrio sp.]|nr:tRNA uridine-5-carboxymethylaminomethyl(34) synthesis GTPase MnmE [Desulfurivibrio sp.]
MVDYSQFDQQTIAAIATPPGAGGIGIIRISGALAGEILQELFRPARPAREPGLPSHRLRYGWIVEPASGRLLDEVMAVYMAAPATYTREEVVEIHGHGGYLVLREILALVLAREGVRAAEPGEFTKRAFLHGRIDLTRAEAVIDLLNAETGQGVGLALQQLAGGLAQQVGEVRQALLDLLAMVEVAIDFPDEDEEIIDYTGWEQQLATGVSAPLVQLLQQRSRGRVFREGAAVAILGRPNVGKSSLLNGLLREERAIVTPVPGTTRDTIEESLDIHGVPVRLIDTAGIRDCREAVEELGIERARHHGRQADLVLLLVDDAAGLLPEDLELYRSVAEKELLLVVNKLDLPGPAAETAAERLESWRQRFADQPLVGISARTGKGLEELAEAIFTALTGDQQREPGHSCVPNARHEAALHNALAAVRRAAELLQNGGAPELLAVELQSGLAALGEIVGESSGEELLEAIFSRFCIGK